MMEGETMPTSEQLPDYYREAARTEVLTYAKSAMQGSLSLNDFGDILKLGRHAAFYNQTK